MTDGALLLRTELAEEDIPTTCLPCAPRTNPFQLDSCWRVGAAQRDYTIDKKVEQYGPEKHVGTEYGMHYRLANQKKFHGYAPITLLRG